MTTNGLITAAMTHYDNVDANDADNAARRLRVLQYAQEVFDTVYYYREWPWRYAQGTLTLPVGNFKLKMPADYHEFGVEGSVVQSSDGFRLEEQPWIKVLAAQWAGGLPTTFTILEQDVTSGGVGDGIPNIQFGGTVGVDTSYDITYLKTSPTLLDTTDLTSRLQFIPVAYHQTVLLPGVVARLKQSEGDSRDWEARYEIGLARMCVSERPRKTTVQQLPMTVNNW